MPLTNSSSKPKKRKLRWGNRRLIGARRWIPLLQRAQCLSPSLMLRHQHIATTCMPRCRQTEFSRWQDLFSHSSSSGQDSHDLEVPGEVGIQVHAEYTWQKSRYSNPRVPLSDKGNHHPAVAQASVILDSSLSLPSLRAHSPSITTSWFYFLNLFQRLPLSPSPWPHLELKLPLFLAWISAFFSTYLLCLPPVLPGSDPVFTSWPEKSSDHLNHFPA